MIKHKHSQKILRREDAEFEDAILRTVFNKYVTTGMPSVLVVAKTIEDIQLAIKISQDENRKIGICSGGHSWSTNHLRDGSLVIDMSHFASYTIDKDAMTATAGPGCGGFELMMALNKQGLFFPAGHCQGVCLGGYLLKGGFGWNSQKMGLACESVIGLDIVTAQGEIVYASETENSDLYWAARGAGSGFFGVIFRFHLRVFPKPKVIGVAFHSFGLKHLEEVLSWAHEMPPDAVHNVEFQLQIARRWPYQVGEPVIEVSTAVMAESIASARQSVAFMQESRIKHKARLRLPFIRTGMWPLYKVVSLSYLKEHRWSVDNMWTHASAADLLPVLRQAITTMPPRSSSILWTYWHTNSNRPDMAFSLEDKIYIAMYGCWKNPEDDNRYGQWATKHMKLLEPHSTGIQLADENLHNRPAPFTSADNMQRLDEIRQKWDSDNLFQAWHSRVE